MATPISTTPGLPNTAAPPSGVLGAVSTYNYAISAWQTFANMADLNAAKAANPAAYCSKSASPYVQQQMVAAAGTPQPLTSGTPYVAPKPASPTSAFSQTPDRRYTPSGVMVEHYGENIPLATDPTSQQLAAAAAQNPGTINRNSPLVRAGPYVIPQDVWFALYSPWSGSRYLAAKSYMEGKGHQIGGGDTAAPGTTGTVHVDAGGNAVPNYGRNVRSETPDIYAGTTSYSLIAGSPLSGWQGQNLEIARATMPFQPEGMITLKGMGEKGLPSYAIPTSSLSTNNPWDPRIVNAVAKERAEELTKAAVVGRAGYSPEMGLTPAESMASLERYERAKQAAMAAGDTALAFEMQNKAQKAARNIEEWSSAYHHVTKEMGIPVGANPYEFAGDLSTELLKGTPTRDPERFSPVSGFLLGTLPSYTKDGKEYGLGIQQDAWNAAHNRTKQGIASFGDFLPAIEAIGAVVRSGEQNVYGYLFGGKQYGGVETRRPLGEGVTGPKVHITTGPTLPAIPASTATPVKTTEGRTVGTKMVAATATEVGEPMTWEIARKSGYFTPGQVAAIDAGLAQSKNMADLFFAMKKPGEYTKTTEETRPSEISKMIYGSFETPQMRFLDSITGGKARVAGEALVGASDFFIGGKTTVTKTERVFVHPPEYSVTASGVSGKQNIQTSVTETKSVPSKPAILSYMPSEVSWIFDKNTVSEKDALSGFYKRATGGELIPTMHKKAGEAYDKIGSPIFDAIGDAAADERVASVVRGGGLILGSALPAEFAYASAPTTAYGGAELGLTGVFASNPVGWGIGFGLGATMMFERAGRLGLTGETKDTSVRSIGGDVGSAIYRAGHNFAQEQKTNALMMYGAVLGVANDFSRKTPEPRESVSSLPKESGTGMFTGQEVTGAMFRGKEAGTGLPSPLVAGEHFMMGLTAGFGMPKAMSAGYSEVGETTQKNKNQIVDNTYQGKLSKEAETGNRVSTPYWWERGTYGGAVEQPTRSNIYTPSSSKSSTKKSWESGFSLPQSYYNNVPREIVSEHARSISTGYDTGFKYWYDTDVVDKEGFPKIDLKLGNIPILPSLGGGGGSTGGSRRGHYPFMETLGFATQKRNPFAKFMQRGKARSANPFALSMARTSRRRKK